MDFHPNQELGGNPTNNQPDLASLLGAAFHFASFRPNQESVCRAAIQGRDVLLVMPTGSGKSLCYQLPGVARGGTTLVISPLIALMDDQVFKLRERGFAVAAIHSGRERAASREACIDYLSGKLQFLFIAPEKAIRRYDPGLSRRSRRYYRNRQLARGDLDSHSTDAGPHDAPK